LETAQNIPVKTDPNSQPGTGFWKYLQVWAGLLFLTALTVSSVKFHFGALTIVVVLSVACAKSILVLLYFMHLRNEKRLLIKLLIPGTLVLLAIFIGLTYTDIITR
jgi:cytochrome c oxidase subunit 4